MALASVFPVLWQVIRVIITSLILKLISLVLWMPFPEDFGMHPSPAAMRDHGIAVTGRSSVAQRIMEPIM